MRSSWSRTVVAVGLTLALAACTGGADEVTGGAAPSAATRDADGATSGATAPGDTGSTVAAAPTSHALPPEASASSSVAPPPTAAQPTFHASVAPITADLAARMASSWHAGCPVPLEDLRYVTATHRTFDGGTAQGELVVHRDLADGMVAVLRDLFDAGYPIRSMRLVDDFGGSDDASMAADNTSAFNCRPITGGTSWSEHSYGRAIDVNPVENPYVLRGRVEPPAARAFADRPDAPGVIHAGDAVVRAFAARGWRWGGDWSSPTDYQHFSTTGR